MSEQTYSGRVSSVVYEDGDFRIAKILLDGSKKAVPITVKGHFPAQEVCTGSWVSFAGKWIEHPHYGRQLSVTRSPIAVDAWTNARTMSALSAQGIGPQVRMKLEMFALDRGCGVADVLNEGDLNGAELDDMTRLYVVTRWRSLRTHLEAAQFLADAGVSASVIGKVWSALGEKLEEAITQDPWILVRVGGISFREADEVAARLGVPLDNDGRVNGAVLAAVKHVASDGHLFASTGQVVRAVNRMMPGPEVDASRIAAAIANLRDNEQLVVDRGFRDGLVALYEPWTHHMEQECAASLQARGALGGASPQRGGQAQEELEKWAQGRRVTLTETQMQAAMQALTEPVSILTGLPGTGKTTTLQAVVAVLRDLEVPFLLAAPTGIAAKRLSSVTGAGAATVHRAFSAKGFQTDTERKSTYVGVVGDTTRKGAGDTQKEQWGYGPDNPHPAEVVIVDESSMLDLHMMYRLLQGTRDECRLVFVGDPYQLPSVGAGDVLRDLVESQGFAHTHLSQIFRQEDTSGIVLAAHAIHAGETPESDGKDFVLIPASSDVEAAQIVRKIATRLYKKRENFQVLSPRHGGEAGVTALNEALRMVLNPAGPGLAERRIAGSVVREGDRIMVIRNDYQNGVYNGDVGKVSRIDNRGKRLEIKVFAADGQPEHLVEYDFTKGAPPIRLAYAQTVHKSQGQEYDHIVVPMLPSFGGQLQRNLLYTAITRAKQRVFIVGSATALARAVANDRADRRNTLLADRLSVGCEQ